MQDTEVNPEAEKKVSWDELLEIIVPPQTAQIREEYEVPEDLVLWHIRVANRLSDEQTLSLQREMADSLDDKDWAKFDGLDDLKVKCVRAIEGGDKDEQKRFVDEACRKILKAKKVFIYRASYIEDCKDIAEALRQRFDADNGQVVTIIVSSQRNELNQLFTNVNFHEINGDWDELLHLSGGALKPLNGAPLEELKFPYPVKAMSASDETNDGAAKPSDDFVDVLGKGFDSLGNKLDSIKDSVDGVKSEVGEVKTEVSAVKTGIVEVKTEVSGVRKEAREITKEVAVVGAKVDSMGAEVKGVKDELGKIPETVGVVFEEKLGNVPNDIVAAIKDVGAKLDEAHQTAQGERKWSGKVAWTLGLVSLALGGLSVVQTFNSSSITKESTQAMKDSTRAMEETTQAFEAALIEIQAQREDADPAP